VRPSTDAPLAPAAAPPRLREWSRRGRLTLALIVALAAGLRFWSLSFGLDDADPSRAVLNNLVDENNMARTELHGLLAGRIEASDFLMRGAGGFLVLGTLDAAALLPSALTHEGGWAGLREDLEEHLSRLIRLHRTWAALFGTLTVLALARLAGRHFGEPAGLIAAAFGATCYMHVRESHIGGVDVLFGLLFVCTLDALLDVAVLGSRAAWVRAGLLAGATTAAKYFGGVLVLHALAAHLLSRRAARAGGTREPPWSRLAVGAACMAASFLALCPSLFVEAPRVVERALWAAGTMRTRPDGGLPTGLIAYHARVSAWYGLGAAVCCLAAWGAWLGLRRAGPLRVLLLFTLLALPTVLAMNLNGVRYALPVLLCLLLLAAAGASRLLALLPLRWGAARTVLAAAAIAACVLPGVLRCIAYGERVGRTDTRLLMLDRLAALGVPPDDIFAMGIHGLPRPADHLPRPFVDGYRALRQQPDLFDRFAQSPPRYILLEPGAFEYWRATGFDLTGMLAERYRLLAVVDGRVDPAATPYAELTDSGVPTHMLPFVRPQAVDRPGPVLQLFERRPD
jgi:hypothetical protein